MATVNAVFSEPLLNEGFRQYIGWNLDTAPHCAISGVTGTGKTYLLKLLLARVSKHIADSSIVLCDYKGDSDFSFLSDCSHFFRFDACLDGLNSFYTDFLSVQKSGKPQNTKLLVFDEWASFINSLDKKEAEEAKKKLSSLLMLGRSFDFHVVLSQQRLDAESFGKSRDNFNMIILLGNPSKEVIGMLFNDYKDQITNDRTRGTGYMLINGCNFQKIVVPQISSMEKVNAAIKEAVLR